MNKSTQKLGEEIWKLDCENKNQQEIDPVETDSQDEKEGIAILRTLPNSCKFSNFFDGNYRFFNEKSQFSKIITR